MLDLLEPFPLFSFTESDSISMHIATLSYVVYVKQFLFRLTFMFIEHLFTLIVFYNNIL